MRASPRIALGGAPESLLRRVRSAVLSATGWRRAAIAFVAGLGSVLALAPFFASPVLFLTLPVLVWLIDGAASGEPSRTEPITRAAVAGWWFGFGYFLGGLFWIGEAFLVESEKFGWALPFAVTLMPAGLALFYAAAAAAARAVWSPGLSRILVLAVALGIAEWLRGHVLTGFPWNALGYALTYPLVLMQGAALVGVYGLTPLAVAVFASPLALAETSLAGPELRRAVVLGAAISLLILTPLVVYGALRLAERPAAAVESVRLRIVQPSVPQREKWRPENQGPIFRDHLELSRHDARGRRDDLKGITHLVWPEAAMPFLPLEHPEALAAIGELLVPGTYLISGALRREAVASPGETRPRAFNSLMVFGPGGSLVNVYDKNHLVPFGEYLPMQAVLESFGFEQLARMRGGFSEGANPRRNLIVPGLPPAGGLICYEAIFPGAAVQGAERPGFLLNVTNDGWFGDTTGPRQHFHQARVRAVEEGLPLVRAANNGISAVVDGNGRVYKYLELDERGVIDTALPAARPPTYYARFGDWPFAAILICFSLIAVYLRRSSASSSTATR